MRETGVPYLDVAIGFVVAFLILSLVPSAINEAIVFFTRVRSKFLWAYLNQLFTTPAPEGEEGSAGKAAERSAAPISSAGRQQGKPGTAALPVSGVELFRLMRAGPARDPRPTESVAGDGSPLVDRLHRQLGPISVGSAMPRGTRTTVKHIPPRSLAHGLLEVLIAADDDPQVKVTAAIDELRGTPIHPTLVSLWATTEGSLERFRGGLEAWFDAEMARLSGLYKRVSRWVLASAAVLVAIIINLDPVALGKDLWRDPERRASALEVADVALADVADPDADRELRALFEACRSASDDAAVDPSPGEAAAQVERLRNCVIDALDTQRGLGLANDSMFEWARFVDSWTGPWQWLLRPVKVAAVTVALFMGAPFWYDALRRLMGVRKGLIKQET